LRAKRAGSTRSSGSMESGSTITRRRPGP
jgi:hypothetical protein